MTPKQKIRWLILAKMAEWEGKELPPYPDEHIDDKWDMLEDDLGDYYHDLSDETEVIRSGEIRTGIEGFSVGNYESNGVAHQLPDGSWVGWPYFYGGGKNGSPEEVEWMEYAYDVNCVKEVRVVKVFRRIE